MNLTFCLQPKHIMTIVLVVNSHFQLLLFNFGFVVIKVQLKRAFTPETTKKVSIVLGRGKMKSLCCVGRSRATTRIREHSSQHHSPSRRWAGVFIILCRVEHIISPSWDSCNCFHLHVSTCILYLLCISSLSYHFINESTVKYYWKCKSGWFHQHWGNVYHFNLLYSKFRSGYYIWYCFTKNNYQ